MPSALRCRVGLLIVLLLPAAAPAQDAQELRAEQITRQAPPGEHPLSVLMRTRSASLRPELAGVHPRVYVTASELDALRQRAHTTHKELWQRALRKVRALSIEPPPAPAQARRAQNEVGLGMAEAAFAYKIEGDRKYFEAAKKYMDAAASYEVWGYASNKPDVDLAAGHLLYGMGWAYDLLYHDLSEPDRARYRAKLERQAQLMYAYFAPKRGRRYAYSQNHVFIPVAGLAVAAYALYGEVDEAHEWAALARAIFDRVLATYSTDGYYYEGFEYWIFSTPWLVHYLDAQAHAAGEDLYDRPGFRAMSRYVAQSMLPDGANVFDFGDTWTGPETRAKRGEDYARTHPGGRLESNYNLLYRMAARFHDGDAQGVAQWLQDSGQTDAEEFWSLIWYDAALKPTPIAQQERWHYFPDHEVVYWRSDWSRNATAIAFKCGPPEGHHAAALLKKFPDWRLSAGHAHPDAGSFIVYANGAYLTGDSGYAGVPMTEQHNTVLVDGRGQGQEGEGHDAWDGVPYERLNQVRIREVKATGNSLSILGEATAAYMPELGLTRFERRLVYVATGITITDALRAARPAVFTSLLHADGAIARAGDGHFIIDAGATQLEVRVAAPATTHTAIEANELIAPGAPGSVDKGERVTRGQRLAISTDRTAATTLELKLSWPHSG